MAIGYPDGIQNFAGKVVQVKHFATATKTRITSSSYYWGGQNNSDGGLEFVMKNYLYGPVIDSKIIKEANVRTYMESGVGKITSTDTAGKVVDQSVSPNPPDLFFSSALWFSKI